MTDDDLDRALFALPLAEPPPDLHETILTATVLRAAPPVASWEIWIVATLLAVAVWLALLAAAGTFGSQLSALLTAARAAGALDPVTWMWLALGASAAWWISRLTLMPRGAVPTYNR